MVDVGMKLEMAKRSLLVKNQEMGNVRVQLDSKGMVLKNVKTLMSAKRKKLVNVWNAAAEIHGVAMNVLAVKTFCTSKSMTRA